MSIGTPPQQSLGDLLRGARSARGASIPQVEAATQIRASYLTALEDGQFHELPPDIYLRRVLATLCAFYDLEFTPVIRKFFAEREAFLRNEQHFAELHLQRRAPRHHPALPVVHESVIQAHRVAALAGAAMVVLLLGGYVVQQVRSFSAAPELVVEQPSGDIHVAHRSTLVRGRVDPGSVVRVNNQEVLTDEGGNFEVAYELSNGENAIAVVAQGKNGRTTRVQRTVSASFPEPVIAAAPADGFVAKIVATDRAWVRVLLDGEQTFEGVLENEDRTFRGSESIVVRSGNAGATRVAINGHDRGAIGDDGTTASFTYTEPSAVGLSSKPPTIR